ncbi:hypothetical protein TPChic_0354a [Treponema pallidum subsp. pallidum str. Chicago]|nr:hypothetical protein TPChic_0354a [Treponema pallidum subsp. pallidum str. Chicago]
MTGRQKPMDKFSNYFAYAAPVQHRFTEHAPSACKARS